SGPRGFHLTNLLLHAAAACLLFISWQAMTGSTSRSAFLAGWFAVHPLRVESVAWVAERKDVLGAFFWMLTVVAYAWDVRRPGWPRYLAVVFAFAFGLICKPMLVTLPFVLLLLDYWPLARIRLGPASRVGQLPSASRDLHSSIRFLTIEKLPLLILAAASCI